MSDNLVVDAAPLKEHAPQLKPVSPALYYGGAMLLACVIVTCVLQLWRADLSVPLQYTVRNWEDPYGPPLEKNGDVLLHYGWLKNIVDYGWVFYSPALSAPLGQHLQDFPMAENVQFGLVRLMAIFTKDTGLIYNLLFLLGFPLVALSSVFAFRQMGLSRPTALLCGLLFTFLPYHFDPGQWHLFLSVYYQIPLLAMMAIWLATGVPLTVLRPTLKGMRPRLSWHGWVSLVVVVLAGSSGAYFAGFGLCFLALAALLRGWHGRSWGALISGVAVCTFLFVTVLINFAPSYLYWHENGRNPNAMDRDPAQAVRYGLRPIELILPERHHRIPIVSRSIEKYRAQIPSYIENQSPYVGGVGVIGLLVLLGWSFGFRWKDRQQQMLAVLSQFSVLGILVACMGGISLLLAFLTGSRIRSYHRLSVYIAFFALVAVGILLDRIQPRRSGPVKIAWVTLVVCMGLLGVADQTSPTMVPLYEQEKKEFATDAAFVARIEQQLPPGAMIFQVPVTHYPESLDGYEMLRPYIHSHYLRWSFGFVDGSKQEQWMQAHQLLSRNTLTVLAAAQRQGYAGIWVDLLNPIGGAVQAELELQLQQTPLVAPNGRAAFFFLNSPGQNRLVASSPSPP